VLGVVGGVDTGIGVVCSSAPFDNAKSAKNVNATRLKNFISSSEWCDKETLHKANVEDVVFCLEENCKRN
jgi:UV DNA damage repair endonuclease